MVPRKPKARDKVAAVLQRNPGRWMTVAEVQRSAALGSHITVGQHLRDLANDGQIEREVDYRTACKRYRWTSSVRTC